MQSLITFFILFISLFFVSCSTPTKEIYKKHELDNEPDNNIIQQETSVDAQAIQGCYSPFGFIPNGGGFVAYLHATPPQGQQCVSETRVCTNGVLSGSFLNLSCMEHADISIPPETVVSPPSN